jgi:tRNA(adenine34) deaminase
VSEENDLRFMRLALAEARAAAAHDDVPVGAVLVDAEGEVLAHARNERELLANPVAHAEVQALTKGALERGNWNLTGTTLYVTLEPCSMCAGAVVLARVGEVVYGAKDPKGGARESGAEPPGESAPGPARGRMWSRAAGIFPAEAKGKGNEREERMIPVSVWV